MNLLLGLRAVVEYITFISYIFRRKLVNCVLQRGLFIHITYLFSIIKFRKWIVVGDNVNIIFNNGILISLEISDFFWYSAIWTLWKIYQLWLNFDLCLKLVFPPRFGKNQIWFKITSKSHYFRNWNNTLRWDFPEWFKYLMYLVESPTGVVYGFVLSTSLSYPPYLEANGFLRRVFIYMTYLPIEAFDRFQGVICGKL